MQQLIGIEFLAATSEEGFTLDELVIKVRELFIQSGMAKVVELILKLVDELLAIKHCQVRCQKLGFALVVRAATNSKTG